MSRSARGRTQWGHQLECAEQRGRAQHRHLPSRRSEFVFERPGKDSRGKGDGQAELLWLRELYFQSSAYPEPKLRSEYLDPGATRDVDVSTKFDRIPTDCTSDVEAEAVAPADPAEFCVALEPRASAGARAHQRLKHETAAQLEQLEELDATTVEPDPTQGKVGLSLIAKRQAQLR